MRTDAAAVTDSGYVYADGGEWSPRYAVENQTGLPDSVVAEHPQIRNIQRQLARWADGLRAQHGGAGSMFDRTVFIPPNNPYDEMKAARTAVQSDDIVSSTADVTESFAFQGSKFESIEADDADVLNQWAEEVNLDDLLRTMWREEYTYSQVVCANAQWEWREYRVRGRTVKQTDPEATLDPAADGDINEVAATTGSGRRGRPRRKTVKLWVPTKITTIDPLKVVPVDFSALMPEQLAWSATPGEIGRWEQVHNGEIVDLQMSQFYTGRYTVTDPLERRRLSELGVPEPDNLLLLNPEFVWRHTLTKADYEAFASVRLKALFPLLDLKRQLIQADRAALVGAANYIILVKVGSDAHPGQPEEVAAYRENYNYLAKIPVIIADQRLSVEIISPKTDMTLNQERYDVLDLRIIHGLIGTLSMGSRGQRNETNVTTSYAVARMMENRRHMIKRAIEQNVVRAITQHPENKGKFAQDPNLVFVPRNVQLGFDASLVQALLALRTQREISRETILEQFNLDQATEAMRMENEDLLYDGIFKTQIPFNGQPGDGTQNTGDSHTNGAQGGRPLGGGNPSATPDGRPKTPSGNSTKQP